MTQCYGLAVCFLTRAVLANALHMVPEHATSHLSPNSDIDFKGYALAFGRNYELGSTEYAVRQSLFEQQRESVQKHNAKPAHTRLWTAGLNRFSDVTDAEWNQFHGWRGGSKSTGQGMGTSLYSESFRDAVNVAEEIDWTQNLTSLQQVKNQGHCGSCWAVTSSTLLEAHYEIRKGSTRSFSAQQLVNCVPNLKECGGEGGCKGATVELALQYVKEKGLGTNDDVPYLAVDQECNDGASLLTGSRLDVGVTGFTTLPENKARPLMQAMMNGPVAISVAAKPWKMYTSGIFDDCSKDAVLGHAVIMVGYGKEDGTKYWRIQNSWGDDWGERGHIRLLRHDTETEDDSFCGTDDRPEAGVECKPYRDSVTVCGMCGMLYDSVIPHFQQDSVSALQTNLRRR